MGRSLLGIIAGAVIAFTIGVAVAMVSMWVYPVAPGIDPSSRADLAIAVATMPFGALLLLMLGWVLAAVAGARVALRVGSGGGRWPGVVVGGIVFAGAATKLWILPYPTWFTITSLVAILIATLLAARTRPVAGD